MSEGSFHELASSPQQFLSIPAAHPLTVLINGLLLALLALPVPLAGLLLLRDVSANFNFLEMGIYVTQVTSKDPNILWSRNPDLLRQRI